MKRIEIFDKKSRTSVMLGVIICLFIAVVFCIVRIATRPPVVHESDIYLPEKVSIEVEDIQPTVEEMKEAVKINVEDRARLIEDNVNIRSGPGTEYDRLGSAYKGFDYKILSKDNSEWIKIEYDNKPAYVFAEYVEIVPMFLNDMGEYEEYAEMDSAADKSDKISSEDESQDEETSDEEGTTEEN